MQRHEVGALPVIHAGKVVGIVTAKDLMLPEPMPGRRTVKPRHAAALALVGCYLMWKKQVVRPKFPAPFCESLMCLGCSTQPAS